jgi:hypothetical protein
MIRRVMDSIAYNSKDKDKEEDKLTGIVVEIDELYIHACMKGKSYHSS